MHATKTEPPISFVGDSALDPRRFFLRSRSSGRGRYAVQGVGARPVCRERLSRLVGSIPARRT